VSIVLCQSDSALEADRLSFDRRRHEVWHIGLQLCEQDDGVDTLARTLCHDVIDRFLFVSGKDVFPAALLNLDELFQGVSFFIERILAHDQAIARDMQPDIGKQNDFRRAIFTDQWHEVEGELQRAIAPPLI